MKRVLSTVGILSFILLANTITVLVIAGFVRVSSAGPTDPACGCDVNADGLVDVSDPIALLDYLFNGQTIACAQGTPPPEPITLEELETVLLQFQPRISDFYYENYVVDAGSVEVLLEAPVDQSFVITHVTATGTCWGLLIDGEGVPYTALAQPGAFFVVPPGGQVTASSSCSTALTVRLWGYWADAP